MVTVWYSCAKMEKRLWTNNCQECWVILLWLNWK